MSVYQEAFLPAWAQAKSAADEIPVAAVYHAIVQVLHRDMDLIGAPSTFIMVEGVSEYLVVLNGLVVTMLVAVSVRSRAVFCVAFIPKA